MNRGGRTERRGAALLALFALFAACAAPGSRRLSVREAQDVLAEVLELGDERYASTREGAWAFTGNADYLGEPSAFRFEWDASRFRLDIEGRLGRTVAFDGVEGWSRSNHGLVRALTLEDLDRERLIAVALVGAWSAPRAPVEVRALAADEASVTLELSLADSPMAMELVVDRASGEPQTLTRRSESGTNAWIFEGWQNRLGALVPTRIRHLAADGGIENTIEFEDVVAAADGLDDERFSRPASAPDNVVFHDEVHPRVETRRVATGHVLVRPVLDGREVGWFVFDTGAGGLVLDRDVADALELERFGEVVAVGVSGRTTAAFRQGGSFRLGRLELLDPIFVDLDLAFLEAAFGLPIAGIVGYDVLAHAVVSIEPSTDAEPNPVLELRAPDDPEHLVEADDLPWSRLVLDERIPCVEASFEGGHAGLFKLDTGAGVTLTFHAPAVEDLDLLRGRKVTRTRTAGVGGHGTAWRGRLAWFELGGRRFEDLEVEFADGDVGGFADRYTLGNLGQGLLSRFRLVFDYSGERVALAPR